MDEDLEKLTLVELLKFIKLNPELEPQVKEVLSRRLAVSELEFQDPYHTGPAEDDVLEIYHYILIRHFKTASKVLKNYGHLVREVSLRNMYPSNEKSSLIFNYVNLYCSEALEQIFIGAFRPHSLSEYKKPFNKVTHVTLEGSFSDFGSSVLDFGDMFPAMRHLTLYNIVSPKLGWVERTYPHLEELKVELKEADDMTDRLTNALIGILIKNNPKIQSLNLKNLSWKLLKVAAENLVGLKYLNLKHYSESDDDDEAKLEFKNVKTLKMKKGSHSMPKGAAFANIEKFVTDARPSNCSRWMEFVSNSKTLKKLTIYRPFSNDEMQRISSIHSQVNKAFLELKGDVEGENVIKFMENNTELRKLTLKLHSLDLIEPLEKSLRAKLPERWLLYVEDTFFYLNRLEHSN